MRDNDTDRLVPVDLESLALDAGSASVLTLHRPSAPDDRASGSPPLWLVGEVDLVTGPDLLAQLGCALAGSGTGRVVVDLSKVTFMDLAGLRMLLRLQRDLRATDRQMVLRAPSPPVRLLLRVADARSALTVDERAPVTQLPAAEDGRTRPRSPRPPAS